MAATDVRVTSAQDARRPEDAAEVGEDAGRLPGQEHEQPAGEDGGGTHEQARPQWRGQRDEEAGRQGDLDELAQRTLPGDCAQRRAEPSEVPAVPDHAVDVTEHPAREDDVEELGPVDGRDRGRQGEVRAERRGDGAPAHRAADRGQRGHRERHRERPRARRAESVDQRSGAEPDEHDREDEDATDQAHPSPSTADGVIVDGRAPSWWVLVGSTDGGAGRFRARAVSQLLL